MIYIKRIFLGLAFYLSSQVFLLGQNADFTFGSSIGFGGALFDNTNYITLGFFDSNVFTALSDEVFVGIDPFGNYGFANNSFSANPVLASAIGETMYIKLSYGYGNAFVTDSSWSAISASTPPATPPLNAALIGHNNASQLSFHSSGSSMLVSSGGIGGTGITLSIPEPSTYALILGLVALGFTYRVRK